MRKVIIATITAALFSSPAFTQQPSQGGASIPDFSGIWAQLALGGFDPPLSGPGPVTNRSRRNGVSDLFGKWVGDYTNPILKPQAAEVVRKHAEISLSECDLSDPEQPMLAKRSALRLLEYRNADAPAAAPDHYPLYQ
jgi:hypothetical protein